MASKEDLSVVLDYPNSVNVRKSRNGRAESEKRGTISSAKSFNPVTEKYKFGLMTFNLNKKSRFDGYDKYLNDGFQKKGRLVPNLSNLRLP